jgi:hypothetical protein
MKSIRVSSRREGELLRDHDPQEDAGCGEPLRKRPGKVIDLSFSRHFLQNARKEESDQQ